MLLQEGPIFFNTKPQGHLASNYTKETQRILVDGRFSPSCLLLYPPLIQYVIQRKPQVISEGHHQLSCEEKV